MKKFLSLLFLFLCISLFSPSAVLSAQQTPAKNYLVYALDSSGVNYTWKNMPIRVYIQPNYYKPTVAAAFRMWHSKLGNIVSFQSVSNPNNAQIIVKFTKKFSYSTAGLTKSEHSGKYFTKCVIYLSDFEPKESLKTYQYSVALHEIGHAIGISGHSPQKNDIMYPQATTKQMRQLSSRDIYTVRAIYSVSNKTLEEHSDFIKDKKIDEALSYTRKFPSLPLGWYNLGVTYLNNKLYSKADTAFKKAISLKNNYSDAYRGRAFCYYNAKRYNEAFYLAKKAFSYSPNDIQGLEFLAIISVAAGQKKVGRQYAKNYLQKHPNAKNNQKFKEIMKSL